MLSADGQVVASNAAGGAAAESLGAASNPDVLAIARQAAQDGVAGVAHFWYRGGPPDAVDFFLIPVAADTGEASYVLALGKTAALEKSLVGALVASRQMFRDLVECSSDFAWETKPDGTFSYVSSRGALGYSAEDLVGSPATNLLHPETGDHRLPFVSQDSVEGEELWLADATGLPVCVAISARPVFDTDRHWIATRGVCKDVTAEREQQQALDTAELRQRLIADVVDAMRNEVKPQHMLVAAARATVNVLGARYCWIVRVRGDGSFTGAVQFAGA